MSDPAALFDRGGWWDPDCKEFASLRAVSEFRRQLLLRWLGDVVGRVIVDLGCGGGLLALPLAERGAQVIGLDLASGALRDAQRTADERGVALYVAGASLLRSPLRSGCADVVLLADVVEHLDEPAAAVAEAARLLRPGGSLFVNTISRTVRSRLLAITLAEGLGYVPRGTHSWRMFVRPDELERMAAAAGLRRTRQTGETPRLLATVRRGAIELRESRSCAVGYAALFERPGAAG
ncbi:MAG: 3-demethylubiquinone-9 3-O-methyltransferase [Planctomycetes bacterium]|nr:3-demethylubiquinone-9 3-O-methyltransferase [Planctomycetota bacterium]